MHQYLLPFCRILSEQQLHNAILSLARESQSELLNVGQISMMYNLRQFDTDPFVIIMDEFHAKWDWNGKWKVLAIAGFNLDGSNFHYLHMKLSLVENKVMGKEEINDSLAKVLHLVRVHGYSSRLMCIISDGCPANLLAKVNAAREYPVLWDVVHLRKLLAEYRVVDKVLGPVYNFTFTAANWRDTEYPPVRVDYLGRIAREVTQLQVLVERVCNVYHTFNTLNRLNSADLELSGTAIIAMVAEVISQLPAEGRQLFAANPYRFVAIVVGVCQIDTPNPDGVNPG